MRCPARSERGRYARAVCLLVVCLGPLPAWAQAQGAEPLADSTVGAQAAVSPDRSDAGPGPAVQRSVVFRQRASQLSGNDAPVSDSGRSIYSLPPMTVQRDRWSLPEDIRQQLWADQQLEIERLQRERERQRHDDAVVSVETANGVVLKILPEYDPYNPQVIDMGIDESETEVITIFGGKF